MKIVVVGLTYPFRGGISHYTTRLCKELSRKHEVSLYSFSRQYPSFIFPGKTQFDDNAKLKFPKNATIDSLNPFSWFKTASLINKENPDLVVFQWWNPLFSLVYYVISKNVKAEKVFLCHNVLPHEHTFIDRILLNTAFYNVNKFIVQSKKDLEDLKILKPSAMIKESFHPTYDIFGKKIQKSKAKKKKKL